jgi:hypothetical protein
MLFPPILRRLATMACLSSLTVLAAGLTAGGASASAQATLPVNYSFAAAAATTFNSPTTSPPGANNFSCRPTAAHPYPVVLVHGTLANMNDSWQAASPILANHGYCAFAFNYGGSSATADFQGTGTSPRPPSNSRPSSPRCSPRPARPRSISWATRKAG